MSQGTPCKNGGLTLIDPHGVITFLETSKKKWFVGLFTMVLETNPDKFLLGVFAEYCYL
jgi:hypothetical protein